MLYHLKNTSEALGDRKPPLRQIILQNCSYPDRSNKNSVKKSWIQIVIQLIRISSSSSSSLIKTDKPLFNIRK